MGLPSVTIKLENGRLGQTPQTEDGIAGMILTGAATAGKIAIGEPKELFRLGDAERLGIESGGKNAFAHSQIRKFYEAALPGAALWVMLVDASVTLEQACDLQGDCAPTLEEATQRQIKLLAVSTKANAASPSLVGGLDADISKAVLKAQALAAYYAENYRPFRVVLDGKNFSGTVSDLTDYSEGDQNRVCIFLCNDNASRNADVGTLLGRAAALPVQRHIGRVKDGPLSALKMYFTDGQPVEAHENELGHIRDKAYISCRTYAGKSGYFFADDPTLTSDTDDYNSLARGRVVDKVIGLAYATYVSELLDEIPLADDGTINPALIKTWQNEIENAINLAMTANGEISSVKAYIDEHQPILQSDTIQITLRILPVGYNKFIEVHLGFDTNVNNA